VTTKSGRIRNIAHIWDYMTLLQKGQCATFIKIKWEKFGKKVYWSAKGWTIPFSATAGSV
jgi:hypothetical protein